jgi:very-short-patch-repair endonuclease
MKELIRHILREHTREIILEMPKALTQSQFLEKARKKHGDKFDYSKTLYKNSSTPIVVTCPIHGDLEILPTAHLNYDCKKCVDERFRKSPESFLKQAKKIHGDKYDYSKTKYTNANGRIIVTCPKHGDFDLRASHHLGGQGCKKCANELVGEKNSLTQDEFLDRAQKIHGDKYDYSKVQYNGIHNDVKIICPIHGEFEQTPNTHLKGSGCSFCGRLSQSQQKKLTKQEFIDQSREVHGKKYDYSKSDYTKMSDPVKIICPVHGEFEQTPAAHVRGQGCRECYLLTNKSNSDDFIQKAKKIHGDKFDYSKVEYTRNDEPVSISCKKHGDFLQTPASHLSGQGCPICKESKGEILVNNILNGYEINFIRQHTFEDCVSKKNKKFCRKLPFDFYMPSQNIAIEYDGQQHFVPVWGEESFKNMQRTDKIKNQYCKKNGIKLIRIPYTMKKEEIEPYILKELGIK